MGERGRASAPGSARAAQSEQRQLHRAMQGIKRTRLALWDDAAVVAARSRRGTAFPRSLAQTRRARAATAALDSTFSACRRARRAASQRVRRGLGAGRECSAETRADEMRSRRRTRRARWRAAAGRFAVDLAPKSRAGRGHGCRASGCSGNEGRASSGSRRRFPDRLCSRREAPPAPRLPALQFSHPCVIH